MKNDEESKKSKAFYASKDFYTRFAIYSGAGIQLVFTVFLFAELGSYLDTRFHSNTRYTLLCLIGGLLLGFYIFLKALLWKNRENKD
ncbi:MAG: AtpZ/AtpI family protein [Deltaproteobacteria bacterium]|nr:AtpZ/AtpI family protein [Deltaproteobacteria bacterium]